MIVLKLKAGLGNQMFQYAYARALALRSNAELALDLSWFNSVSERDTKREYGLHHFNIGADVRIKAELPGKTEKGSAGKLFHRILNKMRRLALNRRDYVFYPALIRPRKHAVVEGYWNSEKYFKDFADAIRDELSIKAQLGRGAMAAHEELIKLKETNALTCIHVRRGDYVSSSRASAHHGLSGVEYYEKAVEVLVEKMKNHSASSTASTASRPLMFILASDDIEWTKENIVPLLPEGSAHRAISNPAEIKDYEEMHLMSLCDHFIIANSTFSWWPAWLSESAEKSGQEKIVIGPKRWIADPSADTTDVMPERWIRI